MTMRTVAVLVLALATTAVLSAETCKWADYSYPPDATHNIPWYEIDLDTPPLQRWQPIAAHFKAEIAHAVKTILHYVPEKTQALLLKLIDSDEEHMLKKFGPVYADEIRGLAQGAGIQLGWATVFQMTYEIEGLCTSIVAQTPSGEIYHGRNLDFGEITSGWDRKNQTWELTEALRALLINVHWKKGGVSLYNSTTFAGVIGLLTGSKKGAFSISVDTRFDENFDKYLLEWFAGLWHGEELLMLTRDTMENLTDYDQAVQKLQNSHIIGPAYIIVGGTKAGQGVVLTRDAKESVNVWQLSTELQRGGFYLLETNYDNWKNPPFFDNRRTPGQRCMNETGSANMDFAHMYNVLQAKPTRNVATTQTVLMHVASGRYEGYKTWCEQPCELW